MARGNFRTDDRVCVFCGFRYPNRDKMPYKFGKGANKVYLCEKCTNKSKTQVEVNK